MVRPGDTHFLAGARFAADAALAASPGRRQITQLDTLAALHEAASRRDRVDCHLGGLSMSAIFETSLTMSTLIMLRIS
jgi:hypothetical protein